MGLLRTLELLLAYDSWCIGRMQALTLWLNDWLSIPQKRAEQSLIGLYCGMMSGSVLVEGHKLLFSLPLIGLYISIGFAMYVLHRKPAAVRKWTMANRQAGIGRVLIQAVLALIALICILPPLRHVASDWTRAAAQIVYGMFYYLIDITTDGEPGRKRKLALRELKKMFGAEWIPKPLQMPW